MAEHLTRAFWLSLPAAALTALFATAPVAVWLASGWLLLWGALFSSANWAILLSNLLKRTTASFIPPVGVVLLAGGMLLQPHRPARSLAPAALLLDPVLIVWTIALILPNRFRRRRPPS